MLFLFNYKISFKYTVVLLLLSFAACSNLYSVIIVKNQSLIVYSNERETSKIVVKIFLERLGGKKKWTKFLNYLSTCLLLIAILFNSSRVKPSKSLLN